ncbi:MAG: anti-sigma factor, partial [Candidatus Didemnitutus sp.]|nr:anti-sigma factor [Candidatus Didemnitutus sp.]
QMLPWALVVMLLGLSGWLASQHMHHRRALTALQSEADFAKLAARTATAQLHERTLIAEGMINQLRTELRPNIDWPHVQPLLLKSSLSNLSGAQGIALWDQTAQRGLVAIAGLPVVSDAQDYQVWLQLPSGPVSVGVFKPSSTGNARLVFSQPVAPNTVQSVAITLEAHGGAATPTGPVVLQGHW